MDNKKITSETITFYVSMACHHMLLLALKASHDNCPEPYNWRTIAVKKCLEEKLGFVLVTHILNYKLFYSRCQWV